MNKLISSLLVITSILVVAALGIQVYGKNNNLVKSDGEIILTEDNTVILNSEITSSSSAATSLKAKELDSRLPSGEPIYLVLDTPGGSIEAGIDMINVLSSLNRPVHTISIFSASMGFQTVQGLNKRHVLATGTLMSHKARGGFEGEFPGQLDARYSFYLTRVKPLDEKVVSRTKGKHDLKSYADLIENEYWCEGEDCVQQGFADSVSVVKCDKSLDGTREVIENFMFLGMQVQLTLVYAKCPTITGILDYFIEVDGKSLFPTNDLSYYYPDLDKNTIMALNQKVKEIIKNKTTRNVVKGY